MSKRKRNDTFERHQQTKLSKIQTSSKEPRSSVILSQTSLSTKFATIESYTLEKGTDNRIHVTDLTLQTPSGPAGHVHLKLDLATSRLSIVSIPNGQLSSNLDEHGRPIIAPPATSLTTHTFSNSRDESKCGFLKLPAELRDVVYADVFVSKVNHHITPFSKDGTALSAAFLRTCRQVYNEGRKWLYAENQFFVSRDSRSRGGLWEEKWSSLGYETMHTFLKTIGPPNINFLRYIRLHLNDESRSGMPHSSLDERRYIHDKELRGIMRLLAEHSHLERVKVNIDGRKKIEGRKSEMPFFEHLSRIKTDHLEVVGFLDSQPPRMDTMTLRFLRRSMQREPITGTKSDQVPKLQKQG